MSKNVSEVLNASLARIRDMADANMVVGQSIVVGDTTIIPVSKITVGLASGGADLANKTSGLDGSFGGGIGCGVSLTPVAFIILQGERVRVVPVDEPAKSSTDRLIEQLPGLVDKLSDLVSNVKSPSKETGDI
jgi:sporulation protein YtfJ